MKNNGFYRYCSVIVVAAGLGLSGLVQAQPCAMSGPEQGSMDDKGKCCKHQGGSGGVKQMGMFGRMLQQVDLTEKQDKEVKSIMDAAAPKFQALREAMQALKHSSMAMLPENGFDEAQAMASAEAHADIMKQMMVLKARIKADLFALLTPEQQAILREQRSKMQGKKQKGCTGSKG